MRSREHGQAAPPTPASHERWHFQGTECGRPGAEAPPGSSGCGAAAESVPTRRLLPTQPGEAPQARDGCTAQTSARRCAAFGLKHLRGAPQTRKSSWRRAPRGFLSHTLLCVTKRQKPTQKLETNFPAGRAGPFTAAALRRPRAARSPRSKGFTRAADTAHGARSPARGERQAGGQGDGTREAHAWGLPAWDRNPEPFPTL